MPNFNPQDFVIEPVERAKTIPSRWYFDPEIHRFELETLFARTWQAVGHVSRLPQTGSHFRADVADNPTLIVRDNAQQALAFYNVCRHRGGPLAIADGCSKVLQCKYHGWTYTLEGMLRGVPDFAHTELFDKRDFGLAPLPLQIWDGLIFVCLRGSAVPLADIVAGISERIAPQQLAAKQFHSRVSYDIACNWKVYADNYLEGYHLPIVHPELSKLLDYRQYVTETYPWYSLQFSPMRKEANFYSDGEGQAFYYYIFPNLMLNILPGRLQTNFILPLSPNRCRVIFDYYYDDITSPQAERIIAEDKVYSEQIQQEDIEICEHVQKGLESDGYDQGRFSPRRESGVHHFQALLKQTYQAGIAE